MQKNSNMEISEVHHTNGDIFVDLINGIENPLAREWYRGIDSNEDFLRNLIDQFKTTNNLRSYLQIRKFRQFLNEFFLSSIGFLQSPIETAELSESVEQLLRDMENSHPLERKIPFPNLTKKYSRFLPHPDDSELSLEELTVIYEYYFALENSRTFWNRYYSNFDLLESAYNYRPFIVLGTHGSPGFNEGLAFAAEFILSDQPMPMSVTNLVHIIDTALFFLPKRQPDFHSTNFRSRVLMMNVCLTDFNGRSCVAAALSTELVNMLLLHYEGVAILDMRDPAYVHKDDLSLSVQQDVTDLLVRPGNSDLFKLRPNGNLIYRISNPTNYQSADEPHAVKQLNQLFQNGYPIDKLFT